MERETPRIAIPVFRSRVAPVFNWCSKIHVFPLDATDGALGQEIILRNMRAFERLRILEEEGVRTLICGALSPDLLGYGESIGLRIIHGIAGEIGDVLKAYHAQHLNHPRFRLPGCGGAGNFRRGWGKGRAEEASSKGNPAPPKAGEKGEARTMSEPGGGGKRNARGMKAGPGGFCEYSRCGMAVRDEQGDDEGPT